MEHVAWDLWNKKKKWRTAVLLGVQRYLEHDGQQADLKILATIEKKFVRSDLIDDATLVDLLTEDAQSCIVMYEALEEGDNISEFSFVA